MRPGLHLSIQSLVLIALAACQSAERGTPPDATTEQSQPAAPETTAEAAPAEPAKAPAAEPAPAAAIAEASSSASLTGVDCALDVALSCAETEVDGCLTGQTTVHQCVSMDTP